MVFFQDFSDLENPIKKFKTFHVFQITYGIPGDTDVILSMQNSTKNSAIQPFWIIILQFELIPNRY